MEKDIPSLRGAMDDDVYPIHLLDSANEYRNIFMSYLFHFNDVLDCDKLADSLTGLLKIGHWRQLGGRLRLKEDGQLEICVPPSWTPQRPAIFVTHDAFSENIATHPLGSGLPQVSSTNGPDSPSVRKLSTDLRPFAGSSSAPKTTTELIDRDAPLLSLHVTTFADSTVVVVSWPHILMDAMGLQALMRNWSLVLHNKATSVSPVLGAQEDVLREVELQIPDNDQRQELVVEKLAPGPLGMTYLILRFLWLMLWSPGFEERTILLPQRHISRLHAQALGEIAGKDEHEHQQKKLYVSEGDVLAAWAAQILAASQPSSPITVANFINVRFRLPIFQAARGVYIQNLLQFIYAPLSPQSLAGPLGQCALSYRTHLAAQSTEEQTRGYLHMQREHVKAHKKLRLVFGDAGATMLTVNNLAKIDFFRTIDFAPAVVGEGKPTGRLNSPGTIVYFHPLVLNKPSVLTSHLRVLGKDHSGNSWLTGTCTVADVRTESSIVS
ncbi:Transcriptional regulator sdnM [Lachnellula suecica]|uniref:Transcriptional regulator sdnM n=1 Tax=Lachnellula suecica TaxID=602035 RepID=A0A8T9BWL6_9HELO|nr:Transcriptional regulator sdnM [Lachnellula suecica]